MSKKPSKPYLRAVVQVGEILRRYPTSTAEGEILARAIRAAVNHELDPTNPRQAAATTGRGTSAAQDHGKPVAASASRRM